MTAGTLERRLHLGEEAFVGRRHVFAAQLGKRAEVIKAWKGEAMGPFADLLDELRKPLSFPSGEPGPSEPYRELDERSTRLARVLISRGAGPESFVALGMTRSMESVVGVWAVLKTGGAFVPVDPNYPGERQWMGKIINLKLGDLQLLVSIGRHRVHPRHLGKRGNREVHPDLSAGRPIRAVANPKPICGRRG